MITIVENRGEGGGAHSSRAYVSSYMFCYALLDKLCYKNFFFIV